MDLLYYTKLQTIIADKVQKFLLQANHKYWFIDYKLTTFVKLFRLGVDFVLPLSQEQEE